MKRANFYLALGLVAMVFAIGHAQTAVPVGIFSVSQAAAGYCQTQTAPTGAGNNPAAYECQDLGGIYFASSGKVFAPVGGGGAMPTLSMGQIQTLPAGSQATASITGTAPNFVLNLGIPVGNTGAQGATGATGAQGPTWSTCTGATISNFTFGNSTAGGNINVTPGNCK